MMKGKPISKVKLRTRLARPCKGCGKKFIPMSKYTWFCKICSYKQRWGEKKK